jgi:hypothetical protein
LKSTARTGDLHIVEWEESFGSDLTVLLDVRAATRDAAALDEALEAAITLTASVAAHLLENGYHFQIFYWQPPSSGDSAAGGHVAGGHAASRSSTSGRNEPEPVLQHRQARRASDLKGMLTALAQLTALPNAPRSSAATLSHLARQAAPSLGRSGVLLIAPTTAGNRRGSRRLGRCGGSTGSCAGTDAASFAAKRAAIKNAGTGSNGQAITASPPFDNFHVSGARTRVVRRGDSLTAALERE